MPPEAPAPSWAGSVLLGLTVAMFAAPLAASPAGDEPNGLLVIEEGDLLAPSDASSERQPQVTGALGRLWESLHLAADSELFSFVQNVSSRDGIGRALASTWLDTKLLAAPNLSITATGFARLAVDGTAAVTAHTIVDVNEAFAKVNVGRATVHFGRLVVPWGRTQASALGDRLNAPDHRRGPSFPEPGRQRQPMWGATVRSTLGSVGVEGVLFARYEATEGSLAAANQGGARLARYQTALVRSPGRVGGLFVEENTAALREPSTPFVSTNLGLRATRHMGDLDVGASIAWGFDETPRLHLRPEVARALAADFIVTRGGRPGAVALACDGRVGLACIGGAGALTHERTTSFTGDLSWALGVIILRAEVLVQPALGALGGKSALVVDDLGLRSTRTTYAAGALGVEGSFGDLFDGAIEILDAVWAAVPARAVLWGVEPFAADSSVVRDVHRVALAASLTGGLMQDRVTWRLRGETGLNSLDALGSVQLRYRLPALGLYVGGRADIFVGAPGTPGWFREDGSLVGVFLGEGG